MSAKRAKAMRDLVLEVGGNLRGDENRKSWLARVARTIGVTPRMARAAWQNEIKDPEHKVVWKLRAAVARQEAEAKDELQKLHERLARIERALVQVDPDFHSEDVDALRQQMRGLGGMAGAGNQDD